MHPIIPLLLAFPAAHGDVHVVGPGGFPTIADAIAAAGDGHVVLVKAGNYEGFDVADKDVTIVADLGADVAVYGTVAVHGLSAGRTVTLQGLVIHGDPFDVAVDASANDGALRIESCELKGEQLSPAARIALQAVGCASVVVRRSKLNGGFGGAEFGIPGGDAAIVRGSAASFFECEIRGGQGGWAGDVDGSCSGSAGETGGDALVVENAAVRVHASLLAGGWGGIGDFCVLKSPVLCGSGGQGGAGLVVGGGAAVELVDTEVAGGPGGSPGSSPGGSFCHQGPSGPPTLVLPGASPVVVHDGPARGLALPSPLREGALAQATATGAPGDLIAVFVAFAPGHVALPGFFGDLLLAPGPILLGVGVAPDGELVLGGPVPELVAPSLVLRAQAVAVSAAGAIALGEAATLVLLDAAL